MSRGMSSNAPAFKWTPPVAFHGDVVRFTDHRGAAWVGTVKRISTVYGYHTHEAYHTYRIKMGGRKYHVNVGCKDIIEVVK